MMKNKNSIKIIKRFSIFSALFTSDKPVLLLLMLCIALIATSVAYGWLFSSGGGNKADIQMSSKSVLFSIKNKEFVFLKPIELSDNGGSGDDIVYEEARPADTVDVYIDGQYLTVTDNICSATIKENTKRTLKVITTPADATIAVDYTSSSPLVTVSKSGIIKVIGNYADFEGQVDITINISNITNIENGVYETTPFSPITLKLTIEENTSPPRYYLPGGVNVLKNPLVLVNTSTADCKVRVRFEWAFTDKYSDETITDTTGEASGTSEDNKQIYNLAPENPTQLSTISSPLSLTKSGDWQSIASSGYYFTDSNGIQWTISTVRMTAENYESFINGGRLTAKDIVSAYTYITYSSSKNILSSGEDYGDIIAPSTYPDNEYTAATAITTSKDYTKFSDEKGFTIRIIVQARQANYYTEIDWFDVSEITLSTNAQH